MIKITENLQVSSVQFSSAAQLCPTLRNPMNHSRPGLPVHHQLSNLGKQSTGHFAYVVFQPENWNMSSHISKQRLSQSSVTAASNERWGNSGRKVMPTLETPLDCSHCLWWALRKLRKEDNAYPRETIRLQSLSMVSPEETQDVKIQGYWPQIAEAHIKGMISVSPDYCI